MTQDEVGIMNITKDHGSGPDIERNTAEQSKLVPALGTGTPVSRVASVSQEQSSTQNQISTEQTQGSDQKNTVQGSDQKNTVQGSDQEHPVQGQMSPQTLPHSAALSDEEFAVATSSEVGSTSIRVWL